MQKRFVSLWFRHLTTDWLTLRQPELKDVPFILVATERNRIIVKAVNVWAERQGVLPNIAAADAKAIIPGLKVIDEVPGREEKILRQAAEWCIRFSPSIALDLPNGLFMDVTGCTHLWGGEQNYLQEIVGRLKIKGYTVRAAMADTVGAAWAVARYGDMHPVIEPGRHMNVLMTLPPAALRLDELILQRLHKLGFFTIRQFMTMQRQALRRRFGEVMLQRLGQALGTIDEPLQNINPVEPYHERLPFLEPIKTAEGIALAIQNLLEAVCKRLYAESKGLRIAVLKGYRIDGQTIEISIGTNKPSHNTTHLFKLFDLKIPEIEPELGIELFTLDALKVEDVEPEQEILWKTKSGALDDAALAELLDKLGNKVGADNIHRYLPQERYWPERSVKRARSLSDKPATAWRTGKPRPSVMLKQPEPIEVMALLPDNPPAFFIYKGKQHKVTKADDAERIEREWWLEGGLHRDYYVVEDDEGCRYWLFRLGHYGDDAVQWFIHGYFA